MLNTSCLRSDAIIGAAERNEQFPSFEKQVIWKSTRPVAVKPSPPPPSGSPRRRTTIAQNRRETVVPEETFEKTHSCTFMK